MNPSTHTQGGAAVGDSVYTAGGDFVGRDQIVINVTWQAEPFTLPEPDLEQLRKDYLVYLRAAYQYLDFKGLPQVDKIAQQLPLDAVYVPLRARHDVPEGETWLRVAGRRLRAEPLPGAEALALAGPGRPTEPAPVDEALASAPALVILGDPGAGKSTLLKVLTLSLAREPEGPLPILVPLNAYAEALAREDCNLHDFLVEYFATRQHRLRDLGPLFDAALRAGQAVVLLDGLDEVQAKHAFLTRLVQDFAAEHVPAPGRAAEAVPGNRLVVTSRIVGYREAPLNGPRWRTYTLVDWGREEITRFADRWTLAFETATHGEGEIARVAAQREREELLAAIFGSPGIERLASNPLLLTILALIKRQGVTLPRRRVELYETYLRTLINAWNKARSLDQRPVGPELDYLETVQVLAPLALWLRETNSTAGLVSRTALEDWLTAYYQEEWALARGPARQKGREFLNAVRHYSNLLVERGRGEYGFLHLTFEEMLAAKGIAARAQLGPQGAVGVILHHLDDPAWHETILLAVGALGIVAQQPKAAGAVLRALCEAELDEERRGRPVVLAGEALLDAGEVVVGRKAVVQVTQRLVRTMQDAAVHICTRREAGLVLGKLGWQPEDLDTFVEIPPGKFLYGNKKEEREIPYRYWIGKYPVTNVQYARFIEDGGYQREEFWSEEGWTWREEERREQPGYWNRTAYNNSIFPVVGVTWYESEAYCNWLITQLQVEGCKLKVWRGDELEDVNLQLETCNVQLPSEEEWERAARGAGGREYPWGDGVALSRANVREGKILGATAICTYPQGVSPVGVWDMSGNVWEWTRSRWDKTGVVLRGGSWYFYRWFARCAYRFGFIPDYFFYDIGFRLVVSLVAFES